MPGSKRCAMCYLLNKTDYAEKGKTGERLEPDPEIVNVLT